MAAPPANLSRENSMERWLAGHTGTAATVAMLAGFLLRLWTASGTFLNPDEALHFRIANQSTLGLVYRASLAESHPPLLYWVLHFVRHLGTSEIWLRLPSVIAGTIFCWLLFRWLTQVTGQLSGFIGLLLSSLLPPVVRLSAEVRQYALLLMFLAGALYLLERALAEHSPACMVASALSLYLAMLSHYSALFFVIALGVYGLLKMFPSTERPSTRILALWIPTQLAALAVALFLYKTHLSHLAYSNSRTVLQGWMSEFYLRRSYFEAGRDNPLLFVIGHSFGVFQFVFGQLVVGDVAGLLFLAAIVLLWRKSWINAYEIKSREHIKTGRTLALFLVLLFAIACGASLAHVYPFGGTRHSAFLIIPVVAGVGFVTARIAAQRWTLGVSLTLLIIAVCAIFGRQHQPFITRDDQSRARMADAMDFILAHVAPGGLILTDYESSMVLGHYLCAQTPFAVQVSSPQFETFTCDGDRIVTANRTTATNFTPELFLNIRRSFVSTYDPKQGTAVWIFQAGWGVDLPERLRESTEFHNLQFRAFGNNIKIFKLSSEETLEPPTFTP
jgi:uncharacterized membrane protein